MIPQAYNNVNVNVLLLIALLINGVILYGSLRINKLMKIPFLRIGKPWNKNAAILCSVPDTHGYVYSQKTGYLYSQMTGYVYSPKTGKPYNSKSHWEKVNQRAYTTTQTWSKTCKPKGLHNNTDLIKNM